MKRSIIATTVALFLLGFAGTSAQTTGGMTLEALGQQLNSSYACSFTNDGGELTLSHRTTGNDLVRLTATAQGMVSMSAVVGQTNRLSANRRASIGSMLTTLNTTLPIGTLMMESDGAVTLRHHVAVRHASITEITTIVERLIHAAEGHRFALMG